MSTIAERVAAEHRWLATRCSCSLSIGQNLALADQVDAYTTHLIEVTEAAVRARIEAEQSAYAIDPDTGVTMRARIDWLRDDAAVDLKSVGRVGGAKPEAFARSAADHGYHIQADRDFIAGSTSNLWVQWTHAPGLWDR